MLSKIKKFTENIIWWSGVITTGIIVGLTIQFVKAWTEPTQSPPQGNLGAPINTGPVYQIKNGVFGAVGIVTNLFNKIPQSGESNTAGSVLTLKNPVSGEAVWAPPSGGSSGADWYAITPVVIGITKNGSGNVKFNYPGSVPNDAKAVNIHLSIGAVDNACRLYLSAANMPERVYMNAESHGSDRIQVDIIVPYNPARVLEARSTGCAGGAEISVVGYVK